MNYLFPFILFSSLVIVSYSAVYLERVLTIHGYENLCFDIEENVLYRKGEEMKWKRKECGRRICRGSNGRGSAYAEIHTCGRVGFPPNCRVEANLALPYPKCCERIICPDF